MEKNCVNFRKHAGLRANMAIPAVILETPEVLVRADPKTTNADKSTVSGKDIFTYGKMNSPLYIMVSTTQFSQKQDIALETALDAVLDDLEKSGAKNMIVKRDDFSTEKGITGIKAYGEFNVQVSDNKISNEKSTYELLLFCSGKRPSRCFDCISR